MTHLRFSGTTKFKPFLPEECQVSNGSYGFELALWLCQSLSKKGICTSYPFSNINYNPNGGPDWFIEYNYNPKDFDYQFPKTCNSEIKILIGIGTECNDGDGYIEEALKGILWHIEIEQSLSVKQRSIGCDIEPIIKQLSSLIRSALESEGIDVDW